MLKVKLIKPFLFDGKPATTFTVGKEYTVLPCPQEPAEFMLINDKGEEHTFSDLDVETNDGWCTGDYFEAVE